MQNGAMEHSDSDAIDQAGGDGELPSREVSGLLNRSARRAHRWESPWRTVVLVALVLGLAAFALTPGSPGARLGYGALGAIAGAIAGFRLWVVHQSE